MKNVSELTNRILEGEEVGQVLALVSNEPSTSIFMEDSTIQGEDDAVNAAVKNILQADYKARKCKSKEEFDAELKKQNIQCKNPKACYMFYIDNYY